MSQTLYNRENPSDRYLELIEQYKNLHLNGEQKLNLPPENTFPGFSILPHIDHIKHMIKKADADFLLDYGCGKGAQYAVPIVDVGIGEKELLVDYWDVMSVHCYDPCVKEFSELPQEKFDGVISTDMLEHCSEEDIPWILSEMFSYANNFLYVNVACYPAKKTLPNGENAHCTVKSPEWWDNELNLAGEKFSHVEWEARLTYIEESCSSSSPVIKEIKITGNKNKGFV